MDFFGFFKDFFGPSVRENHQNDNPRSHFLKTDEQEPRDPNFNTEQFSTNEDPMGFQVFSNPLEMHRYFEKQMNDMLRTFGFQSEDSFFGFSDGESIEAPFGGYIEEPGQMPNERSTNLRDQFLKPGFQQPRGDVRDRSDTDLDGQIQPNDLDSMFKQDKAVATYHQPQASIRTFGQSIISKTIRNSDGSIETHRTIKDNQGNQETTVTRKWGDKEYSVKTTTDKDGKQVVMENLTNLDENDLQKFLKGAAVPDERDPPKHPHNWFPFDKYFK